jgi:fructose-1-phosphate kinase PfkB-like protein
MPKMTVSANPAIDSAPSTASGTIERSTVSEVATARQVCAGPGRAAASAMN